jgi:hypothetical protein
VGYNLLHATSAAMTALAGTVTDMTGAPPTIFARASSATSRT